MLQQNAPLPQIAQTQPPPASICPPEPLALPSVTPDPLDEPLEPPEEPLDDPDIPLEDPDTPLEDPLLDPPPLELDPLTLAHSTEQFIFAHVSSVSPAVHLPPVQPQSPAHLIVPVPLSRHPA